MPATVLKKSLPFDEVFFMKEIQDKIEKKKDMFWRE